MHETGLTRRLVELALARAEGRPLRAVGVRIGALTGISPAHLREHWDEAVRGTAAASARLEVQASEDPLDAHAAGVVLLWVEVVPPA